jgi:catechol 2,3-dioxygenase-like lactoylglutathione lyase family enzyme
MEHIIAKLLQDFEQGKMNRRQLIQSLAMAATAASAAAPARAAESPFKAIAVNQISYQVKDYKVTRDFYAGLFGMEVKQDDDRRQCYLAFGDTFLLPRNGRPDGKNPPPYVDHIAYTIEKWDKDAVKAELEKHGLKPTPDTDDSFHVRDPDGFNLQISGKGMHA